MADNDDRALQFSNLFYHGKTGECVDHFLKRFEVYADIRGWNEEKKMRMLLLSLRDDAIEWYGNAREGLEAAGPVTYATISQGLKARFQTPNNDYFSRIQLSTLQQAPDESVSAYAARVQELGSTAFPTDDIATRSRLLVAPFIAGLAHADVKKYTLASQPASFTAAFKTAQNMEASLGATAKPKQLLPPGQVPPVHQVNAAVDQVPYQRGMVRGVPPGKRFMYTPEGRPICDWCGIPGHLYRECGKRLSGQPRRQPQQSAQGYRPRNQQSGAGRPASHKPQQGSASWAKQGNKGHGTNQSKQAASNSQKVANKTNNSGQGDGQGTSQVASIAADPASSTVSGQEAVFVKFSENLENIGNLLHQALCRIDTIEEQVVYASRNQDIVSCIAPATAPNYSTQQGGKAEQKLKSGWPLPALQLGMRPAHGSPPTPSGDAPAIGSPPMKPKKQKALACAECHCLAVRHYGNPREGECFRCGDGVELIVRKLQYSGKNLPPFKDTGRPCPCGETTRVYVTGDCPRYIDECSCCGRPYTSGKRCGCCTKVFLHSCTRPGECGRQHEVRRDKCPWWMPRWQFRRFLAQLTFFLTLSLWLSPAAAQLRCPTIFKEVNPMVPGEDLVPNTPRTCLDDFPRFTAKGVFIVQLSSTTDPCQPRSIGLYRGFRLHEALLLLDCPYLLLSDPTGPNCTAKKSIPLRGGLMAYPSGDAGSQPVDTTDAQLNSTEKEQIELWQRNCMLFQFSRNQTTPPFGSWGLLVEKRVQLVFNLSTILLLVIVTVLCLGSTSHCCNRWIICRLRVGPLGSQTNSTRRAARRPSGGDQRLIEHVMALPGESGTLPILLVNVGTRSIKALLDTGATISLVRKEILGQLGCQTITKVFDKPVVLADGQPFISLGVTQLCIQIGKWSVQHSFRVVECARYDMFLGTDFLEQTLVKSLHFDLVRGRISLNDMMIPTESAPHHWQESPGRVAAAHTFVVPPRTRVQWAASLNAPQCAAVSIAFEPTAEFRSGENGLFLASSYDTVRPDGKIHLEVVNCARHPVTIYRGKTLGYAQQISSTPAIVSSVTDHSKADTQFHPEHLAKAFTGQGLTPVQAEQVLRLLERNADIFAKHDYDLGHCEVVQHAIDTQGHAPIRQQPYRIPFAQRKVVEEEIDKMLKTGVIQPTNSPWASPIVLVAKKTGEWRVCCDLRKLNAIAAPIQYPLPRIEDLLYSLSNGRYLSSCDLASGYWQISVQPSDRPKTAFTTFCGNYEFVRMPFGLQGAPATFQCCMETVLSGLLWSIAFVYLDDILIVSPTFEKHLEHLQLVFDRLRKAGFKLKLRKCEFLKQEVSYLGHKVSAGGLKPDPKKLEAVQKYKAPTNQTEVRSFIGLCSFYRRFVHNFAKIAAPLTELTRDVPFHWGKPQAEAFETLKKLLTTPPILAYPNFEKPFIVSTDASSKGVGAILSQLDEQKRERPIMYASRVLNAHERKYAVAEQEALAVIFAFKQFRPYIYMQDITLITDHAALKYLLDTKTPSGRLARWGLQIQEYRQRLTIQHKPGKLHAHVDALSRAPLSPDTPASTDVINVIAAAPQEQHADQTPEITPFMVRMLEAQKADPQLGPFYTFLQGGEIPPVENPFYVQHLANPNQYHLQDDLLVRGSQKRPGQLVVVVPKELIPEVLHETHDSVLAGHFGVAKTYERCAQRYYWFTMLADVRQHVLTCRSCNAHKRALQTIRAPLNPITVKEPWQLVGTDVVNMPLTERGNRFIIVFTDYFTHFCQAFALPDHQAPTVARLFVDEIICRFGCPRGLRSDRGPEYMSLLFQEVLALCDVRHLPTTAYSAWSNGRAERVNGIVLSTLSHYANQREKDWDRYLPSVIFAYNTSYQVTLNETPFFLTFGRDARTPVDAAYSFSRSPYVTELPGYKEEMQEALTQAYQQVTQSVQRENARQKLYYDQHAKPRAFQKGDLVRHYQPTELLRKGYKLAPRWSALHRIVDIKDPLLYLQHIYNPTATPITVHVNRVKPATSAETTAHAPRPLPAAQAHLVDPHLDEELPEDAPPQMPAADPNIAQPHMVAMLATIDQPIIAVQLLSPLARLPTRATEHSAGLDLYSTLDVTLAPHSSVSIPLELAVVLPSGTYGRIAPRSSLALSHSITVLGGVIDADFRGPINVLLHNLGAHPYPILAGMRIAQLICEYICSPIPFQAHSLPSTSRKGGFGSSGQ